jgi:DNA-binding ferritin-like protein
VNERHEEGEMAESSKEAWDEVGERFAVFGRALAARYKQLEQERGATTEEDRRKLEEAMQTVTRTLDQAFTSLGDTIRDPNAKQGLKDAANSVGTALGVTFSEVSEEIRKRVRSSGTGSDGSETPPSA